MKKLLLPILITISIKAPSQVFEPKVNDVSPQIFIPNVFTPNDNGKNDIFKIINITTEKINEFNIFNRWGVLVYYNQNNTGWDGRYNGVFQNTGVYIYYINYTNNDSVHVIRENVTLIR